MKPKKTSVRPNNSTSASFDTARPLKLVPRVSYISCMGRSQKNVTKESKAGLMAALSNHRRAFYSGMLGISVRVK